MKITKEIREFNEKCLIDALEEEFYYCEIDKSFCFEGTKITVNYRDDKFHIRYVEIVCLNMDPIIFKKRIKQIIHDIKRKLKYNIYNDLYNNYSKDLEYYKDLIS